VPTKFDDPQPSLRPKGEVKYGAKVKRWQPKDEFDPEIFNRSAATAAAKQSSAAGVGPPATH